MTVHDGLDNYTAIIAIFLVDVSVYVNRYTPRADSEILRAGGRVNAARPTWMTVVNTVFASLGTYTCVAIIVLDVIQKMRPTTQKKVITSRMLVFAILSFVPNAIFVYADQLFLCDVVSMSEQSRFVLYLIPIVLNFGLVVFHLLSHESNLSRAPNRGRIMEVTPAQDGAVQSVGMSRLSESVRLSQVQRGRRATIQNRN